MDTIGSRLVGKSLQSITHSEGEQWFFHFGGKTCLNVCTVWRIVSPERILIASDDDGQQFGLPAPVNAQLEGEKAIKGAVACDASTGDLNIAFDSGLRLDALNISSGYEAWIFADEGNFLMVGRNE